MTHSTVSRASSSMAYNSTRLRIDSIDKMPMKISYPVFFSSRRCTSAPVTPVRTFHRRHIADAIDDPVAHILTRRR